MPKKHKKTKSKRHTKTPTSYEGVLERTYSGVGYVTVDGLARDLFIPPPYLSDALSGDLVRVKLLSQNLHTDKTRAKIVRILRRKRAQFVATLHKDKATWKAHIHAGPLTFELPLVNADEHFQPQSTLATVEVILRGTKMQSAQINAYLPEDNAEQLVRTAILYEKNFQTRFPADALAQTDALTDNLQLENRQDFRGVFTCTIDPDDAKDFDDALSVQRIDDHNVEVGIHIADVSHFVQPDTALDREALERGTSVYLPGYVCPMLPERISNDLCSLIPQADRLAFACVVTFNTQSGAIVNRRFTKTIIHSQRRFSYEQVQTILEQKTGEHAAELLLLDKIAKTLRQKRIHDGAIDFSSQENKYVLDQHFFPVDVLVKTSQDAHKLIEEFMLLANRLVAKFLSDSHKQFPQLAFPYRIHDTPDPEKLEAFVAFVTRCGYAFNASSPQATAHSYNTLLQAVKGKDEEFVFDRLGIRAMAKAAYNIENIGHYGLAFKHYTHFTSPIRRYPDILTHRALAARLQNAQHFPAAATIQKKCLHCSERERAAIECERTANKYKQIQFLSRRIGQTFAGVISGVSTNGFWVETIPHHCEGYVPLHTLADYDTFAYQKELWAVQGIQTKTLLQLGNRVNIRVEQVDLERRESTFAWLPPTPKTTTRARSTKKT